MYYGCLFFDVDLLVLVNVFKVLKDKFELKGVKLVCVCVINIINELLEKIIVEEFCDLFLEYMKKEYLEMIEYVFFEEELVEINCIKDIKFGIWDWNYGKLFEFNVCCGIKFISGKVEVFVNVFELKI